MSEKQGGPPDETGSGRGRDSPVITFYSYKGGVGRSMALANAAVLFATEYGQDVVAVDWDLEAPGLHRFFGVAEENIEKGVIDYLDDYKEALRSDAPATLDSLNLEPLLIEVPGLGPEESPTRVRLLPAGNLRNRREYARKVNEFDWLQFYRELNGAQIVEYMRQQLKRTADVVLIDSRTGITDVSGICTLQLPDIVVLVFAFNEQNIAGVVDIARDLAGETPNPVLGELDRHPEVVLLPSRKETGEILLLRDWEENAAKRLDPYIKSNRIARRYPDRRPRGSEEPRLLNYIQESSVPYVPFFAYGEEIGAKHRAGVEIVRPLRALAELLLQDEQADRAAEEVFATLTEEQQALAPQLFTRLVEVERDGRNTSQPVSGDELGALLRPVADIFEDTGILTRERDTGSGRQIVQLADETLIQTWGRLRDWVEQDREFLLWRQQLQDYARYWTESGEDDSTLIRGSLLRDAEERLAARPADLSPTEQSYVRRSIAARRRARRQRVVLAGVGAAIIAAVAVVLPLLILTRPAAEEPATASPAAPPAVPPAVPVPVITAPLVLSSDTIQEGEAITVTGEFRSFFSGSHDIDIQWGDGSSDLLVLPARNETFSATHSYFDTSATGGDKVGSPSGLYSVSVRVRSPGGLESQGVSTSLLVQNVAPTLVMETSAPIDEGGALVVTGSFSDPGRDSWEATVDYGDLSGTRPAFVDQESKTLSLDHTYSDDGTYTVTVTITDDDGGADSSAFSVEVLNVAPSVAPQGRGLPIEEGDRFLSTVSFADPGRDAWEATVDYGDRSGAQPVVVDQEAKRLNLEHVYSDDGAYEVVIEVEDGDGGVGSRTFTVEVFNVAPVVILRPAAVDEGDTFVSLGSFADPGDDSWSATVDYGDASGPQPLTLDGKSFVLSKTYTGTREFQVTVRVEDSDGAVASETTRVTVLDIPPRVFVERDDVIVVNRGSPFSAEGFFDDFGAGPWTARVDYGESGPMELNERNMAFALSHTYDREGVYAVSVEIEDDNGLVGSDSFDITVVVPDRWSPAGTMAFARAMHTATSLESGSVLVAGGLADLDGRAPFSASTQVYDPGTGDRSAGGDIEEPRAGHTATLLRDGRVLMVGGARQDESVISLSEIYDPSSSEWARAGEINEARLFHTATLLDDGRVLIVGGERQDASVIPSAEIYDPSSGDWSFTGAMNEAREVHTATLLGDGSVLVVGGLGAAGALPGQVQGVESPELPVSSAEIYDPASGIWSPADSMTEARMLHTATRLEDGKVLVVGGSRDLLGVARSVEIYDPSNGTWLSTGELTIPRDLHTSTLLEDGRVLVVGGQGGSGAVLVETEVYDSATGAWSLTSNMRGPRIFHTATLSAHGWVLVTGGADDLGSATVSAEIFNPKTSVDQEVSGATVGQAFGADGVVGQHGQEFTAGQNDLVAVDLFLGQGFSATNIVEVAVEIREGSFDGALLAAVSRDVLFPTTSPGSVPPSAHFHFDPSVALVPGDTYVIRVRSLSNIVWFFVDADVYSGGRMVNQGTFFIPLDFGFRTYFRR